MKIDYPIPSQGMELAGLWQEAFGDSLEFIEGFFCTGFSPSRCRCLTIDGKIAAALYWFDAACNGQRFAYLYAVATAKAHRGRGLCRKLMEDTHAQLKLRGYDGILLVPQTDALREMYAKLGYTPCTTIREFSCEAAETPVAMQRIDRDEYAEARRALLPAGGTVQDGESIAYLETMAFFYRGKDFLVAAGQKNSRLHCPELLGNAEAAPGILAALNCGSGSFRTPGEGVDFAMFLPLEKDIFAPTYFGLAFD